MQTEDWWPEAMALSKEKEGGEGRQMGTTAWGGLFLLGCAGLEAGGSKLERDTNHMALFVHDHSEGAWLCL